jgi:hypothetical protein
VGGAAELVARARPFVVALLGKGLGFFVIAGLSLVSFNVVLLLRTDLGPVEVGAGVGAAVAAYFGGGGWKAHAEAKGGSNGSQPAQ